MARPLRIQYTGAAYHVVCRGDDRKPVFHDDRDRHRFIEILNQSLKTYSVTLYCYVLMDNHFHFFLETPLGNLSEFMRHLNITYTSHYNRRHKRTGHLFQGRYKSILVEKDAYAVMLSRYIHLNPVLIKRYQNKPIEERLRYLKEYPWSSLSGYLNAHMRVAYVEYTMLLDTYGGDTDKGRKAYERAIVEGLSGVIEIADKIVGQSILGSEGFIKRFAKTDKGNAREIPSARAIGLYKAKECILEVIEEEFGVRAEEIASARNPVRQVAMELLYSYGGMKGQEIGALFKVDYSTVSQNRKRLREKIENDEEVRGIFQRITSRLSIVKI